MMVSKATHISRINSPFMIITFDDGPDPRSTPRLLSILSEYGVRATFFCIGRQVEQHPDLAKAIIDAGHDCENHGYSHINLAHSPRAIRELTQTRELITLHNTTLVPTSLWCIIALVSKSRKLIEHENRALEHRYPGLV